MRWLLHGGLAAAVAEALRRHGHQAQNSEEVGLNAAASAEDVFAAARKGQFDLITADASLAAAPYEQGLKFGRSVVFLQLSGADVEQDDAVDRLFARYKRLTPGRLYTVTESRVKVRQLPGSL
ncbi:MAG TPA: DUF5615 family PIN-like protein [Tepidisphaeraceae bacterium]|nr:DUF5615 family PIN-like protein [Tepidisphaeraceae bacterium]